MTIELIIQIALFTAGLGIGSFINMLAYRLHRDESLWGRSYSDFDGKPLAAIDLIPVISYVIFFGKDRRSGKRLPIAYPIVELLSGFLAVLVFTKLIEFNLTSIEIGLSFFFIFFLVMGMLLFAVYDYHYWEVDMRAVVVVAGMGLLAHLVGLFINIPLLPDFGMGIAGAAAGAALIWTLVFLTKGGGMGDGDIFLFAILGLLVGLDGFFWAFMLTVLSGSLVGIIMMFIKKQRKGLKIQFAPFISLGTIAVILFRPEVLEFAYNLLFYSVYY